MSKAKKFKVETRLSKEAFRPGGLTVEEALRRADVSLEVLREPCEAVIDDALRQIEARFGPGASGRADEPFGDLYQFGSRIVDASIFAKTTDIDQAARALCQLTALCEARDAWDWVAVDVHIEALRMLRAGGASISQKERQAILTGLKQVTLKRVGDPDTLSA